MRIHSHIYPNLLLLSFACFKGLAFSHEKSNAGAIALSWDGVVADTTGWRIRNGISAALTTWPELTENSEEFSVNDDNTWLENKMLAIAPYLDGTARGVDDEDIDKTAEFSLLARLLIEEQKLDPSIGKSGKYASRYHPQGSHKSIQIPTVRSTRPLTVGEVQANWREHLLDTTLVRYAVIDPEGKKSNPIPFLEKNILEQELATEKPLLCTIVADAIVSSKSSNIIIMVRHESDQRVAEETLASDSRFADIPIKVLGENDMGKDEKNLELFVSSSWKELQEIQESCFDKTNIPELALASWTCSIDQQNQADQNSYVNVVTQDDLAERLSSRLFMVDPS